MYGRNDITIETDHLPLVRIIDKPIGQVPLRLQKMMLKLQPYNIKLVGNSGKDIPIADALSRAPITETYTGLVDDLTDYQICATEVKSMMAFSDEKQRELQTATNTDTELVKLREQIVNGWLEERSQVQAIVKPYWDYREELTVYDGILFKGERVLIPKSMRTEILRLIHSSHQGIVKSKQMARDILFWNGMNKQIEEVVSKCSICQTMRHQLQKEPMMSTEIPSFPWEQASSDLCEIERKHYLVTVDHYSGYIEVDELKPGLTTVVVIQHLKSTFSTHGIPKVLYSDNGPQFNSKEFRDFKDQ